MPGRTWAVVFRRRWRRSSRISVPGRGKSLRGKVLPAGIRAFGRVGEQGTMSAVYKHPLQLYGQFFALSRLFRHPAPRNPECFRCPARRNPESFRHPARRSRNASANSAGTSLLRPQTICRISITGAGGFYARRRFRHVTVAARYDI